MTTVNFGIIRCIYGFGTGALCCLVWRRTKDLLPEKIKSVRMWSLLEIVAVISVLLFVSLAKETAWVYAAPFVFFMTIYIFTHEKGIISKLLLHRFFVLLGTLSYSIYMTHAFIAGKVFTLGGRIVAKVTDVDTFMTINGKERLATNIWMGDALTLLYLAVVIAVSILTYKYIEEPGRKYFRKTTPATKPLPASA